MAISATQYIIEGTGKTERRVLRVTVMQWSVWRDADDNTEKGIVVVLDNIETEVKIAEKTVSDVRVIIQSWFIFAQSIYRSIF